MGAQQLAGAVHDRAQDRVHVADPREVTGGVEQGFQLGLAATALGQRVPQPQREGTGLLDPGQFRRVGARPARRGRDLRELLTGAVPREQLEQT